MVLRCSVIAVTAFILIIGLSHIASAQKFEIASVKANLRQLPAGNTGNLLPFPGGRINAEAALLSFIIQNAYQIRSYQLLGVPDWVKSARYDIEAKAADGNVGFDQLWSMLQSLLEDRFKLKVHHETRQLPVYELTVARGGSKLQTPKAGSCQSPPLNGLPIPPPPPPPPGGAAPPPPCGRVYMGLFSGKASLTGRQAPIAEFVRVLSNVLGRPVIEKTGLSGTFDIDLPFAPDAVLEGLPNHDALPAAADPAIGATIFTAIQEQLGLKLDSTKGPVAVVVIDSIERPSEN